MENENENVEITEENENVDYIKTIQDLKANTVSKEKYNELKKQNKELLDSLVNGTEIEGLKDKVEEKKTLDQMRKETFDNENLTDLEYVQGLLQIREEVMANGERDPFLPNKPDFIPTEQDEKTAQKVADVLQECIDEADGNNELFLAKLGSKMVDDAPSRKVSRK